MNNKLLCIYHGNCADGFAAAWVVRAALGEAQVEFYPGVYNNAPPDVTGRDVLLVDFSYKYPVMQALSEVANSIRVIDHHKSARDDLMGRDSWNGDVELLFNMDYSGAMLTWLHYFGEHEPPQLLKHIEDRDLWKFRLPATREIQAAVFSYPYDFVVWDGLMDPRKIPELITEGIGIERKHHKDIAELIEVCWYWQMIGGYKVPVASMPYTLVSDAASEMAKRYAPDRFAACYWDTPEGRLYSLRSTDQGMDVSKIAFSYGGGGHKNASGFRVGWGDPLATALPFDTKR